MDPKLSQGPGSVFFLNSPRGGDKMEIFSFEKGQSEPGV